MEHEHTTDEFYFGATGLGLGKNYMFGIFATMEDGKRTDVRSMTYKTREYLKFLLGHFKSHDQPL